jgi:hypothetical protein
MPKPQEILNGLQTIVNDYSVFAIIWHIVFYLLIIALVFRWQPSNRVLGALMCVPLLSVAVFAWITGNPFNGILFAVASRLQKTIIQQAGGTLYSADLAGSAAGALLMAVVLIPLLGLAGSLMVLIIMNMLGLLYNLLIQIDFKHIFR